LLGYVLLGIALARSRVIPLWAAGLFIVGIPFQMIAYPTRLGILQLICFALIFIGSIPAALAMLKGEMSQRWCLGGRNQRRLPEGPQEGSLPQRTSDVRNKSIG
jgi:hypothetical protein